MQNRLVFLQNLNYFKKINLIYIISYVTYKITYNKLLYNHFFLLYLCIFSIYKYL